MLILIDPGSEFDSMLNSESYKESLSKWAQIVKQPADEARDCQQLSAKDLSITINAAANSRIAYV